MNFHVRFSFFTFAVPHRGSRNLTKTIIRMSQTLLEKLQLKDEKSLLIQGLPSSIEKQFTKLAFTKNVTPLLKIKKIDFALVFAVNEGQLKGIINEVLPACIKIWKVVGCSSSSFKNCDYLES
jgi:hypothetical protein